MRSIRLSLMLYFVGLLTLALGLASLMVYRSAETTMADKQRATLQLIQNRYEARRTLERKRVDDRLLEQALALAGRVQVETDWVSLHYRPLTVLGAGGAASGPYGLFAAAPWLVQTHSRYNFRDPGRTPPTPPFFATDLWRYGLTSMRLNDSELLLPSGAFDGTVYYQIDSNELWTPLRSESLGDESFPRPDKFGDDKALYWEPDTLELTPGQWVRRVRVKASSARRRMVRPTARGPGSGFAGPGRPREQFHIILQVAADVRGLNARLDELAAEQDEELAAVRAETAVSLSALRGRLLAIAAVTFVATVAGTFWLVWLGLVPLRRLSEAVSRVSPRDFHLPLDAASLPAELTPVVQKLAGTLEALKAAFGREKQATADISHELRTPLAAILMTTDLALRKPRRVDEYREMFTEVQGSAKHMNQIVERMLTLARLDAGVALFRALPVDVADVAEQCAAVVRPLAEEAGLSLVVRRTSGPGEAELKTDPDKLREVVNNLLHNAVQYNRPGGSIGLTVGRVNGHVRVEVADTGIGIPEDARGRIFERFFRADPSRHTDGMNAGLGLAIVKEYIELMAGRIDVESEEGRGTTFRVELPVSSHGGTGECQ